MLKENFEVELCRADGESRVFTVRRCGPEELSAVLAAQDKVIRGIKNKEIFVSNTETEMQESLDKDFCLGAYCGGELAAFTLMVINRVSPRNLGTYLELDDEGLRECVTYDTTFVLPEHRGFGLQRYFNVIKDEYSRRLGAKRILTTVSPLNAYSLNNALSHGFSVVFERPMYSGVLRCLLEKRLL